MRRRPLLMIVDLAERFFLMCLVVLITTQTLIKNPEMLTQWKELVKDNSGIYSITFLWFVMASVGFWLDKRSNDKGAEAKTLTP